MKNASTPAYLFTSVTLAALALTLGACETAAPATSSSTPAPAPSPAPMAAPAPTTAPAPTQVVVAIDFDKQMKPFFEEYCLRCHGGGTRISGGVNLSNKAGLARVAGNSTRSTLYNVLTATNRNHMPPQGQEQPEADDLAMIKQWIAEGANISDSYPSGT